MVSHPTLTIVHLLGGFGTCLAQFACHLKQRFLRLSQIANKRRPVVHLGIDVDGIFRVPWGVHFVVPYTLQVSRLSARLTRRNQQIATILHHQRHHIEVSAVESTQALVGRQATSIGFASGATQCQLYAVVLLLVFLDMVGQKLFIWFTLYTVQRLVILLDRIATHVVIVHEIGGGSNIECGSSSIVHLQRMSFALYLAVSFNADAALGFQTGFDALLINTFYNGSQFIDTDAFTFFDSEYLRFQLRGKIYAELQFLFLAGFQLHNNHVVGLRCKDGTFVFHAITLVGRRCYCVA